MTRTLISSGSDFETTIGYSRAVVDGDYVFISGTTGYDYATMSISSDVVEQAEQCFRNIDAVLQEASSSWSGVVRVRYLFADKSDFESCWPVFRRYLGDVKPAATMMETGLMEDVMKLEVEVTARVG